MTGRSKAALQYAPAPLEFNSLLAECSSKTYSGNSFSCFVYPFTSALP